MPINIPMITQENTAQRTAKIFFRSFCKSPPIPNPNATRDTNGKKKNIDEGIRPAGASFRRDTITKSAIMKMTARLVINDAIPRTECFISNPISWEMMPDQLYERLECVTMTIQVVWQLVECSLIQPDLETEWSIFNAIH